MTKKELASQLQAKGIFETKAEAERKIDAILDTMEEALLSGDSINFIGWGKLEVVNRAPRLGRNPKTGEEIKIEAKKTVKFKPGKTLVDKIN